MQVHYVSVNNLQVCYETTPVYTTKEIMLPGTREVMISRKLHPPWLSKADLGGVSMSSS